MASRTRKGEIYLKELMTVREFCDYVLAGNKVLVRRDKKLLSWVAKLIYEVSKGHRNGWKEKVQFS